MSKRLYVPSRGPDDWQRLLADPIKQWKVGYSARTLAQCWEAADGWPPEVAAVLRSSPEPALTAIELLLAIPEFPVRLPQRGKASQTDLFVLGKAADGHLVTMVVEGKVNERFDKSVDKWNTPATLGKMSRLQSLTRLLGLSAELPPTIRYQLLHRAASALLLAARFNTRYALMLIHSFSPTRKWFEDYQSFVRLFNAQEARLDQLLWLGELNGIGLYAGWVSGDPGISSEERMVAKGGTALGQQDED